MVVYKSLNEVIICKKTYYIGGDYMIKIKREYCTEDKVQVMLSNASSQIIFNSDEIICFKSDGKKIIYTYKKDLGDIVLPYCDVSESNNHLNHLFSYDKPYVQFTNDPAIGYSLKVNDGYYLDVLLFKKSSFGAEFNSLNLNQLPTRKILIRTDAEGVMKFLRRQPEEDAKYILHYFKGIQYVDTRNNGILVDRYNIDLDDDSIIRNYLCYECDSEQKASITSIKEVPPHIISNHLFEEGYSVMFVSKNDKLFYIEFDIKFLDENKFLIEGYSHKLILSRIRNLDWDSERYNPDPHDLDDLTSYPISPLVKSEKPRSKILSLFQKNKY